MHYWIKKIFKTLHQDYYQIDNHPLINLKQIVLNEASHSHTYHKMHVLLDHLILNMIMIFMKNDNMMFIDLI